MNLSIERMQGMSTVLLSFGDCKFCFKFDGEFSELNEWPHEDESSYELAAV